MQRCILLISILTLLITPEIIFSDSEIRISLGKAVSLVLKSNPELKSAQFIVEAKKALIRQAGYFPNPEFEIGAENFGVNEVEASVSQPFELGGKRSARKKIAKKELEIAQVEYEKAKRELTAETTRRFITILGLQEQLKQIEYTITVVESSIVVTKHRVESGAAKEIDIIRTEMELSELKIEKDKITRKHRQSMKHLSVLFINVPLALIGGVVGLFLTKEYLSVPASVGFIALFGIAVQNGLVLVTYINQLRQEGLSVIEAVKKGSLLRLRPVLMTALTTVLGLVPLLLSRGMGSEVQRPLAVVVVFGLLSSTFLTLFLLPSLYEWFAPKLSRDE